MKRRPARCAVDAVAEPSSTEQLGGEVLCAGGVDRDGAGLGGHRGAHALRVHTVSQLNQGVLEETGSRDGAAHGLVEVLLRSANS